jgi:hypothetical protein
MLCADREVDAEAIPRATVMIFQVLMQTPPKIARQSHVIEILAFVKSVDTLPMPNISPE